VNLYSIYGQTKTATLAYAHSMAMAEGAAYLYERPDGAVFASTREPWEVEHLGNSKLVYSILWDAGNQKKVVARAA
jgi:hypothetical protein